MQTILRRSYATISNEAAAARSASTPLAVRIRRLRRRNAPKLKTLPGSDALQSSMTPSEFHKFTLDKYKGFIPQDATEAEWLQRTNQRRQRIRGFRRVNRWAYVIGKKGDVQHRKLTLKEPVGEKVYLPNVLVRLVPNPTKKGEPYNPHEATFRIPQSFTKTDMRSYLHAVYGVETTYIRTDNYVAPIIRTQTRKLERGPGFRTYKRATVGLVDPFYFPDMVEDMSAEARKKYTDTLEQVYEIQITKDIIKENTLSVFKKNSKDWEWDGPLTTKKSVILRRVAEQRAMRERKVERAKQEMLAARSQSGAQTPSAEA